jgi:hypothetical protein
LLKDTFFIASHVMAIEGWARSEEFISATQFSLSQKKFPSIADNPGEPAEGLGRFLVPNLLEYSRHYTRTDRPKHIFAQPVFHHFSTCANFPFFAQPVL